ncbi:hypothetical protein ACFWF2_23175, partial [Nocardia sp. NPDC060259]
MTEKPATPRTPDGPEPAVTVAEKPAPGTISPAGQSSTDTPQPWTAGWQAAATTSPVRPMPPLPPPPPPTPQRWQCVARPAGVLPAAAVAGIVGATVIPVDRPGIGWLLAGGVIAGALCVVDYRARSRNTVSGNAAEPAAETAAATGNPQSADSTAAGTSALAVTDPADSSAAEPTAPDSDAQTAVATGTTGAATAEVQAAAQNPAGNAQDAASTSAVEGSADV